MNEQLIISDYCIIRDNRVWLNGSLVFEVAGESPAQFFQTIYRNLQMNYPKFFKMDNLCKLGFLATEILLQGKNLLDQWQPHKVGVILANAGSSIDTDRNHQHSIADPNNYFPSPSVFVYTLANIVVGEICIRHKLTGEGTFFIEKEFNPGHMQKYVQQLFSEEIISACIAGWVDMDGDQYNAALYFVEKSTGYNNGIANFESNIIHDIYLQRD